MFKAQILAELIKKYPGLPKEFLGVLADKMAPKVTEENKIEGAIAALTSEYLTVEDLAAEWQRNGDNRATQAVNTYKAKQEPPKPPAEPAKPDPVTTPAGETETDKKIRELSEKLAKMEADKAIETVRADFNAKLKEKKIPAIFAKNIQVTSETNLDELVTSLETDYQEFVQENTTQGLRTNAFVPGGGGKGGKPGEASKAEVDKVIDNII